MDDRLREKVETLDGSRRKDAIRRAAVHIEDIEALLQINQTLKSTKAAGATPTAAEHDALVDDIAEIHRRLVAITQALQVRVQP
nr:hypothetical protein [Mesorhizobium sp.]